MSWDVFLPDGRAVFSNRSSQQHSKIFLLNGLTVVHISGIKLLLQLLRGQRRSSIITRVLNEERCRTVERTLMLIFSCAAMVPAGRRSRVSGSNRRKEQRASLHRRTLTPSPPPTSCCARCPNRQMMTHAAPARPPASSERARGNGGLWRRRCRPAAPLLQRRQGEGAR